MAWTAPASFSVGEIVTSTKLNTHLRDNLKAMAPVHYSEITANVTLSGTTYTSPTVVLAGSAVTYEARPILIEFSCPLLDCSSNTSIGVYDDTTHIATVCYVNSGNAVAVFGRLRITPTAASHTYNIRGWSGGASIVNAGAGGGSGAYAPTTLRVRYDEFG